MITALALIVVVGVVMILLRSSDGGAVRRPLSKGESIYAGVALLPVILTLLAPGIIVLLGSEGSVREWNNRLSNFGILLSLGLTVVGTYLLVRKRHEAGPNLLLCAAVVLAAVPAALLAVLYVSRR